MRKLHIHSTHLKFFRPLEWALCGTAWFLTWARERPVKTVAVSQFRGHFLRRLHLKTTCFIVAGIGSLQKLLQMPLRNLTFYFQGCEGSTLSQDSLCAGDDYIFPKEETMADTTGAEDLNVMYRAWSNSNSNDTNIKNTSKAKLLKTNFYDRHLQLSRRQERRFMTQGWRTMEWNGNIKRYVFFFTFTFNLTFDSFKIS